jgi:hypothetical protein
MLQKPNEQIRASYERAAEPKRKAGALGDPALNADFPDMERRWLVHGAPRLQEISTLLIQEGNIEALYERYQRLIDAVISFATTPQPRSLLSMARCDIMAMPIWHLGSKFGHSYGTKR